MQKAVNWAAHLTFNEPAETADLWEQKIGPVFSTGSRTPFIIMPFEIVQTYMTESGVSLLVWVGERNFIVLG
jgi:hypothetical protein